MEILALKERILNTISLHESHFREFKSALEGRPDHKSPRLVKRICADIAEALVAFANADGGELLIGVEDNGEITGIPHSIPDIDIMKNAVTSHVYKGQILPIMQKEMINFDGNNILFFSVSKGTERVFQLSDGRCVQRKDKETIPADHENIKFERQEQKSRSFDRGYNSRAQITDLDIDLIQTISDDYIKGISPEKYLQQAGLADYSQGRLQFRNAALLLFGKNISLWFPKSQVRILRINGDELKSGAEYNVVSDEMIQDNIFNLLNNTWNVLRPFLAYKTDFGSDATFSQRFMYPEFACREALVNAIAHRDYIIQNGIDVLIFNNRLEIKSPGAILSTLGVDEILKLNNSHESRNAIISKVLRENKIMRELGEGIQRIFEEMSKNDLTKPSIDSDRTSFILTLYHKSVYSSKEQEWIKLFDQYKTDNNEKKIIAIGIDGNEISPKDIYTVLNTSDRNVYDKVVTSLRVKGILVEIRSNLSASQLSKKKGISKQKVKRFNISLPDNSLKGSPNKLFLSKLTEEMTESEITAYFSKYGKVARLVVARDQDTNHSRGFGFLTFESTIDIESIILQKVHYVKNGYLEVSRHKEPNNRRRRRRSSPNSYKHYN